MKAENTFCQMCTDHQQMGAVFIARFISIFSFDIVSFGAGLTNISLRTFALATLFGLAPPTFAFTYLGNSMIGAQWPLIAAGAAMVLFFLAMPKILTKYPDSRFARRFLVLSPLQQPSNPHGRESFPGSAAPIAVRRYRPHDRSLGPRSFQTCPELQHFPPQC